MKLRCLDCGKENEVENLALNSSCTDCDGKLTQLEETGLTFNEKEHKVLSLRHLMSNLIRKDTLEGENYLVCPTVLICVGVHNDFYYPPEELAKFPDSWSGRPVVIDHPDLNGKPVTANSPDIVERQTVGQVFNVRFENDKLKGEVWINIDKCKMIAPEVLRMLEQNQKIEVSTGLFTEHDQEAGVWNEENFIGTVYNYRPDHLALLPNGIGACSWEDGGGLPRVNKEKTVKGKLKEKLDTLLQFIGIKNNELSHDQIRIALADAVKETLGAGDNGFVFVNDVFSKDFIYGLESEAMGTKFYRQNYEVGADEVVSLVGDKVEVQPTIEYVPVTNESGDETGDANDQGVSINEGGDAMRSKLVDALIANGVKSEEDREELMKMDEEALVEMAFAKNAEATESESTEEESSEESSEESTEETEGTEEETAEETSEEPEVNEEKPQSVEEFLANAPEEIRDTLSRAHKRDEELKANMVSELIANESCPFSKEELSGKSIEELEKLVALSGSKKNTVDFSGRVPAEEITDNSEEDAVPSMPVLCEKKDK